MSHIWLRHEYKPDERRAPLTPEQVGLLLGSGHQVTVESSECRVFKDDEYESRGAEIAAPGSWHNAPKTAFILGIKEELQSEIHSGNLALQHRHIYFAHVFKGQKRTPETMRRFALGKGTLLDLEYLVDKAGKRVAAFSYSAGFAGAIAAVYVWTEKELGKHPPFALPNYHLSRVEFVNELRSKLLAVGKVPTALVIGARGRSGQGAVNLFNALGIEAAQWGRSDTEQGGPFSRILDFDIMCNCVFLTNPVAPFLTIDLVNDHCDSRLSVVADVSNDLSYNPIFGISRSTRFKDATICVAGIDVIEIENLPVLTPLDSSIEYANQLFPHLLELASNAMHKDSVWERAALKYFEHHDIPQIALECGRELGEMYAEKTHGLDIQSVRQYFTEFFAKNQLSATDRCFFVDYLIAGASELLTFDEQEMFATLLAKADLNEIYDSAEMRRHHSLLKAIYRFTHSLTFECMKPLEIRDTFFEMCDGLAEIVNGREGAQENFLAAKTALLRKLGSEIESPDVRSCLAEIEQSIASTL